MNKVNILRPVADICDDHPELIDLLVDMGFKPLGQKIMRETLGRKVSLKTGTKVIGLPLDTLIKKLEANGYTVVEEALE